MGIEYTQVFTSTALGSAGASGYQYFQLGTTLQTAGSAFVVKYLSVSSTGGITNSAPAFAVQMTSNTSNVGAGNINIISNTGTGAANIPIILLNNLSQAAISNVANQTILLQNYIGVNVNMLAAGTFSVTISYSLIPQASPLIGNFGYLATAALANAPLLDASSSKTRILKSAMLSNFTTTETYNLQFVLQTGGVTSSYLSQSFSLAPGAFVGYSLPTYIPINSSLALYAHISGGGNPGLSCYTTYTQES